MGRRDFDEQERRRQRRRWAVVGVVLALLAVGGTVVAYRFFAGRAVLLRAGQLEGVLTESLNGLGQKQVATADCPDTDLHRRDSVVCDVSFTDGSTARFRFGVKGRPGNVTPTISWA